MNVSSIQNLAAQVSAPSEPGAARLLRDEQRNLIQAVKAVNASGMLGQDNELTFVQERTLRRAAQIVNKQTGEVVDQIPAEYVLRMAEQLNEVESDLRMANTIYNTYLEAEVFGADPVKLIHMLYRGAVEAVGAAHRHLAAKQIRERSRQVNKAWNILQELSRSLDLERGGKIARRLGELYDYMQRRLIEANAQQSDAPLAEVESVEHSVRGLATFERGARATHGRSRL